MQLARLLHRDKTFRVSIAALDGAGVLRREIEKSGISEIVEFPLTSFYDQNFARQLLRCAAFIRRNKIQIVHTHDFYTNVFGMLAARLANVPGKIASKRETGEMRTRAQQVVEQAAFRLADKIVVNAEAVREFLKAQKIRDQKIVIVYNGLDLNRLQPKQTAAAARLEFGLPVNGKIVTLVANLRHRVKNQSMFLRTAARVREKFARAAFVLAGEGELRGELEALAANLKIADAVYFIGRCEKVADLLEASDVCVLSSRAEGFSNAILEYMAARRPIVATAVGGAAEAITAGETGFLVESDDDAAMAEKILFLLKNPEVAARIGARGRETVEAKFSLEAQLENTKRLYFELLKA